MLWQRAVTLAYLQFLHGGVVSQVLSGCSTGRWDGAHQQIIISVYTWINHFEAAGQDGGMETTKGDQVLLLLCEWPFIFEVNGKLH